MKIISNRSYRLEVSYQGKFLYSEVSVPEPPVNLASVKDTLLVVPAKDLDPSKPPEQLYDTMTVTWNNSAEDSYFVLFDNVETSPVEINPDGGFIGFGPITTAEPFSGNSFEVTSFQMSDYGVHRVRVFRVNEEYIDLFETIEQDSRNLQEPPSNIQNGLGIFTAFSGESVFFKVKKEIINYHFPA